MDQCQGVVIFWDNTTKIGQIIAFRQTSDDQKIEDMEQVGVCCFRWSDLDYIYKSRRVVEGDRIKLKLRSHPDLKNKPRASEDFLGLIELASSDFNN